ncbi:branched-chain amino acid ABC transporter substrate-binding protein [Kitasatospora sp. NPDC051914]|uniref:branched-chain amino acid ABC transporter substrate-binding protein n=1 Tax=Kitasatospora sp. NPDC051914 TaxID=3154945 RepID=UPI00341978BF
MTAVPDGRPPARQGAARRATVLAVALATLAVGGILTWTLTRDTGKGGGTGGSAGNDSASTTTVVIGLDAPLTGDLASLGLGIKNSADLAVKTANRTQAVPGVTFELQALDDQAKPAVGQENASRFVSDAKVLGVVGPLNSSVAQAMLPELTTARLVDVSPSNTNPALSQGDDWAKGTKSRPYPSYFRVATTDAIQGPFAARYLHLEAKKSKLFVIDDQKTYGAGLAAGFKSEFTRIGGTVVGAEHINPGEHDFATLAAKVRSSGADAVYYGGEYPEAAPLSQALKQAGANIPLMGGDGIFDTSYPASNPSAEGDLATSIGAPAAELPGGQKFLADYGAAGYAEDSGIYGGYGYDAAWAVVEAVKAVVAANGGTLPSDARGKVADAMEDVAFDGVSGRVAFDEYGDTTNRQLTVYAVRSGQWSTVKTGTYAP